MTDRVVTPPVSRRASAVPPARAAEDEPPVLRFDHLDALTGEYGLFEHAEYDRPRLGEGYTTDDNARVLVLLAGMPPMTRPELYRRALDFVVSGRVPLGWLNRRSTTGEWRDRRGSDDCHGRALWGLGAALAAGETHDGAVSGFLAGLDLRSPHLRSTCYGLLGAVQARNAAAVRAEAEQFLDRHAGRIARPRAGAWMWPESRLTYANARVPQALIETGAALGDSSLLADGLELLAWLKRVESHDGVFSFTPVGGRGPDDTPPGFDQQPIEAWAMADACLSAWRVDGGTDWRRGVESAGRWFLGENDCGVQLYDPETGAGYDGLEDGGRNLNRGAESTLSALGALASWHAVRS